MIIEITEEEREYIERMCRRSELLAFSAYTSSPYPFDRQINKIRALKEKLKGVVKDD